MKNIHTALFSLSSVALSAANPSQPNIILILADDMGYSDLGCYGSEIKTPHLDSLAATGLRFSQFYNAGRSCPSRSALLTGLYPHQAGVGDMLQDDGLPAYGTHLNMQCVTLAEMLKSANYHTIMSGKWHVGSEEAYWPQKRGFDDHYYSNTTTGHYFGVAEGRKYIVDGKDTDVPGEWILSGTSKYKLLKNEDGSQWYATDAITNHAMDYIKKFRETDQSKPYFLYLAYTAPHWPLHAFEEDIAKYQGTYLAGWDSLRVQRLNKMIQLGLLDEKSILTGRNELVSAWETLPDTTKVYYDRLMSVYAAMIDRMDQNIGRLLNFIRETNEIDNTVIIFLSDNGGS
ncbi:MAG: sulfatase-like hydrolase/transferase, partial [Bacteroidales bacterium]|nr:sulfatase-like hydrolase/transferase [Bacteroidales bacterium]